MGRQQPETVASIKGFDQDLRCRGYQFALGETFVHSGRVKHCEAGFHACDAEQHPLSVFQFYPPAGSRYCEVVQGGKLSREIGCSKIASATITIGVELTIGELVKRAWDYVWTRATKSDESHVTIDYGAASSTGYQGAASSTGDYGAASSTGYQGAASSTGYQGAASSTGNRGAASSTGYQGAASSTGYQGAASGTGKASVAMASGYAGKAMAADGCAIFLVERDNDFNIINAKAAIVGTDGIKPGVFYTLRAGQFVEAN